MIETSSETWEEISRWADKELSAAATKLYSPRMKHDDTMFYRGIIAALTRLKAFPTRTEVIPLDLDTYS